MSDDAQILKFRRVTIRGAQPSARFSEEICLSEGSAGVSPKVLRGLSEGSAGSLRGFCGVMHRRRTNRHKRATTNVQNGWAFFFLFSFRLFQLWNETVVKPLDSKRKSWRKNSEKL